MSRVLGVDRDARKPTEAASGEIGFEDMCYDFKVPAGFQICKPYKGRNYVAVARGNAWRLDGRSHKSLNKMSVAIGADENAWANWFFVDPKDNMMTDILRSQDKVHRRT